MGQFIAGSKTIVSIYPVSPEPLERLLGDTQSAGRTTFTIEGAPKGEFRVLEVADMWYLERDWQFSDREPQAWKSMLQLADITAGDLTNSWTNCLIGARESGGKPGIAVYDGPIPEKARTIDKVQDARLRVFLADLSRTQDTYFEYLYYDGQKLADERRWNQITVLHRVAAKHLGKHETWVNPQTSDSIKDCPACFTKIDARAFICPNCRTQIAEMPAAIAALAANESRPPARPASKQ